MGYEADARITDPADMETLRRLETIRGETVRYRTESSAAYSYSISYMYNDLPLLHWEATIARIDGQFVYVKSPWTAVRYGELASPSPAAASKDYSEGVAIADPETVRALLDIRVDGNPFSPWRGGRAPPFERNIRLLWDGPDFTYTIEHIPYLCGKEGVKCMGRLFGTDGAGGVANTELSCETAMAIGRAAAMVLAEAEHHKPKVVIGKDTRISSDMLEAALVAGFCSVGADASAGCAAYPGGSLSGQGVWRGRGCDDLRLPQSLRIQRDQDLQQRGLQALRRPGGGDRGYRP